MAEEVTVVCSIAQQRHRSTSVWRNLWTLLLWVFGVVIVVFLALAIFFYLRQEWLQAGLITLGTIIDGVGIKWVTDRRAEAVSEENEVYHEFASACRRMTPEDLRQAR